MKAMRGSDERVVNLAFRTNVRYNFCRGKRGSFGREKEREREREMTHLEGGMERGVGREESQLSQDEEGENLNSLIISFPQSQQTARQTAMEF